MAKTTGRSADVYYKNFQRGLNILVNATQIRDDELQEARNCLLADQGSVTKRWGSGYFGNASAGTGINLVAPYYSSSGTRELVIIEGGFAKKYNVTTSNYDLISGASFASGVDASFALLGDVLYISNGIDPLTKYQGDGLSVFSGINAPTSNWATRGGSLASGQQIYSYRVSAFNNVGETLACAATTVATATNRDVWNTDPANIVAGRSVTINWNAVTGASGYNIYGVIGANEMYLDHVDGQGVTSWIDYGTVTASQVFSAPTGNTTIAPKGRYILEFKSSLLIADSVNQSRVWYSAGVDKPESFLISDGGGYVDISKNNEDGNITGMKPYQNKAVIFKERAIWQLDFTESTLPSISTIQKGLGCLSNSSIVNVENDLFFVGQKIGGGAAIYVLGNEPNYLNVLRTNELSARVRPDLLAINRTNFPKIRATYFDSKYIVFFANGSVTENNFAVVYDRERLGWTDWDSPKVSNILPYYDPNGSEWLIFSDPSDNRVSYFNQTLIDDKGTTIAWKYRTKELNADDPYLEKYFKLIKARFRDVKGYVTINVWKNSTENVYTIQVALDSTNVNTSFLSSKFRVSRFRKTTSNGSATSADIIRKRIPIMRIGQNAVGQSISLEVIGEQTTSKATMLDAKFNFGIKSKRFYDRSENINI